MERFEGILRGVYFVGLGGKRVSFVRDLRGVVVIVGMVWKLIEVVLLGLVLILALTVEVRGE